MEAVLGSNLLQEPCIIYKIFSRGKMQFRSFILEEGNGRIRPYRLEKVCHPGGTYSGDLELVRDRDAMFLKP